MLWRRRIAANVGLNLAYRTAVGAVGGLVLIVGVIAIPYPGPGWLIVFAGLGILSTEFAWANRLHRFVRTHYDRFMVWFARQSAAVKAIGVVMTCVVVLVTLWLLGTFAMVGGWFGIDAAVLESPVLG